jgi:hypothetical protein
LVLDPLAGVPGRLDSFEPAPPPRSVARRTAFHIEEEREGWREGVGGALLMVVVVVGVLVVV